MSARAMREGYVEHDHVTEWQECDTCHLRTGAGITISYDATYYADDHDPDRCPRPGCDGRMGLPVATVAARVLGRRGGRAGRGASQRRGDSTHYATLGDRPVVAVRHTAAGELLEDWPIVGRARSLTAAIRVVREAGYTVPDRGTPGYCWDPQDRAPHQDDAHLTDAERQAERVSCWSVPVLV